MFIPVIAENIDTKVIEKKHVTEFTEDCFAATYIENPTKIGDMVAASDPIGRLFAWFKMDGLEKPHEPSSEEEGTMIIAKTLEPSVQSTKGGESESGVKEVLIVWLKKFSKQRVALFGMVVALIYVSTANLFNWIMSNPPFIQATTNFSGPTSWSYLGMWVYIALLLLAGFIVSHAVLTSNRPWLKTFAKRISGMSPVQLFILIIYAPVAVTLVIQYFISIFTGASFPLTDFFGGLLSWTIFFFVFTGLAYVVGNVFRRQR